MRNYLIGFGLAAGIVAAVIAALMGARPQITEGTDTSWQTQSEDAGFGSYGPM